MSFHVYRKGPKATRLAGTYTALSEAIAFATAESQKGSNIITQAKYTVKNSNGKIVWPEHLAESEEPEIQAPKYVEPVPPKPPFYVYQDGSTKPIATYDEMHEALAHAKKQKVENDKIAKQTPPHLVKDSDGNTLASVWTGYGALPKAREEYACFPIPQASPIEGTKAYQYCYIPRKGHKDYEAFVKKYKFDPEAIEAGGNDMSDAELDRLANIILGLAQKKLQGKPIKSVELVEYREIQHVASLDCSTWNAGQLCYHYSDSGLSYQFSHRIPLQEDGTWDHDKLSPFVKDMLTGKPSRESMSKVIKTVNTVNQKLRESSERQFGK